MKSDDDQEVEGLSVTPAELTGEVVSAALSAVPVAGGPMAAIANGLISRRQNRRLNKFLVDLAADMKGLEQRINRDFAKSEEFEAVAEDVFSKAAETRQQEKLDALRAIFLNTLLSDRPSYDATAEIAQLVHDFQARHIVMLRILADPLRADQEMGNVVGSGGGIATSIMSIFRKLLPEWTEDEIDRTWAELHERKLHSTPGTKVMMTDRGIHQLEGRLTRFGQHVVGFLTHPD